MSTDSLNSKISDDELSLLAQNGDKESAATLLRRYKNLVIKCSRPYFIIGQEDDDLIQEGMIGLYKAILNFKPNQSKFITFAYQCIKSSIIDAIKLASGYKHKPLNNFAPLLNSEGMDDDSIMPFEDSPEDIAERLEGDKELMNRLTATLSKQELLVYHSFMSGLKLVEIASRLSLSYKTVDNALQRIRRKIKSIIRADGLDN